MYNVPPSTTLTDGATDCIGKIIISKYSVMCGKNNCGKSYILKSIFKRLGRKCGYLGPARYANFTLLTQANPAQNWKQEQWNNTNHLVHSVEHNMDTASVQLERSISEMKDSKRDVLVKVVKEILGYEMKIELTDPHNKMSQYYVSVDGHNISYSSSGFRLAVAIIAFLLDDSLESFLIDEPELGISPEAQSSLSMFLSDSKKISDNFPHIKSVIVASHSPIFLDRKSITNNYRVTRNSTLIHISQLSGIQEFHELNYFLLGNRLDHQYLPNAIVIVEGKTDHAFIEAATRMRFSNANISIIMAGNDGRIKEVVSSIRFILGDIQKSPYKNRIISILDKTHEKSLPKNLESMGLAPKNIVVWDHNGIEYYYPQKIIDEIFLGDNCLLTISDDVITCNQITHNKNSLSEAVIKKLSIHSVFPEEFNNKYLKVIEEIIG